MNNISVIIPTLSNTEGLQKVLACLHTHNPGAHVVVVNNGKGEIGRTEEDASIDIHILQEKKNVGFAPGVNHGAKYAIKHQHATHLVLLNDDVEFAMDWIGSCMAKMKKEHWHACAPIIRRLDGSIENVGYQILPLGRAVLITDPQSARTKDGLTAAALVINAHDFEKVGGFDERMFAYLEDVELFLRARKHGLEWGVDSDSFVTHTGQVTSSKMPIKKAWLDVRNWMYLIMKHWGLKDLAIHSPHILAERARNLSGLVKALLHITS